MRVTADQLQVMGFNPDGTRIKTQPQARSASAVESESDLHAQIIAFCERQWPKWLYGHSSMAHKTRSTLGWPDFVIMAPGKQTLFIEVKSKTGKLSREQVALQMLAQSLEHTIFEVRSFEEFISVIEDKEIKYL